MSRRSKWISALLLIAALVGFGCWLRLRPVAATSRPIAAAASLPAVRQRAGISIPAPMPILAHKTPTQGDPIDAIEICGVGKVKLDRSDLSAVSKYLDALTKNSRLRWLATLRDSDDYRARASGLYLEGILDRDSPQKDPAIARDELVQLAVGTQDPAILALAYTRCVKGSEDFTFQGACPQLKLDDWTRADPDNAVPWLQLAAKARRENNPAAEAAAFAQAAQARRYDTYTWSLFSFAQGSMPNDVTASDRWILTTEIVGVEAAMPMPYMPLFQYCSRDALSDATVHRECNALAELMVSKAATLIDLSAAKLLGAHVGWPAARLEKLTQEVHASFQALNEMTWTNPRQQWNCDSVARGNEYMSQWDELNERGLAKQAIERSGESDAELSRKYEESIKALTSQTQQTSQAQPSSQAQQ
jgi:hypothetical protein